MNKKTNILYILFSIINILFFIAKSNDVLSKRNILFLMFITVMHVILYYILKYIYNKKLKDEYIYLIFSIIFGLFMLLALPSTEIPDTREDYLRTLEVSQFHLTSVQKREKVGRSFSTNIDKVFEGYANNSYYKVKNVKKLKLNNEKKFYNFSTKSLYSFVCYIPQSIGVKIGTILNLSIYMQTILGRITNYAVFVLLIFYSIKIIPFRKELIMFLTLLPITIQQSVSLNPDALTLSISIFLISYICYLKGSKNKLDKRDFIILTLSCVVMSLCKIVYLPFCLLIFLIPNNKFKSKKQKIIFCLVVCLLSGIINLIWLKISSNYLVAFHNRSNSSLQLKYILSNPITYMFTIFNTLDTYLIGWILQMIGISLGVYTVQCLSIYIMLSLVLLTLILYTKGKSFFNKYEKIYILLIILGIVILIFTSLYMQWTKPYNNLIEGVQGRYFIPLLYPLLLCFNLKVSKYNKLYDLLIVLMPLIILFLSLYKIVLVPYNF